MNTLKSLVLVKSVAAAALLAAGIAIPAVSHASPDDGVICRPGYSAQFNGTSLKCTKTVQKTFELRCTNTRFPTKVIRAPGVVGDTSGGRDLCVRPGINIGSTDSLNGLVQGQDFVFAEAAASQVAALREASERAEELVLGLPRGEVDAASGQPAITVNGGFGSNDEARVSITLATFPIPAPDVVRPVFPVGPNLPNLSDLGGIRR